MRGAPGTGPRRRVPWLSSSDRETMSGFARWRRTPADMHPTPAVRVAALAGDRGPRGPAESLGAGRHGRGGDAVARNRCRIGSRPLPSRPMTTPPVEEIERRLRWPALPTLLFVGILVVLLALVAMARWSRPKHPGGLPSDAALLAVTALPDSALGVLLHEFRFRAAAFGGPPRGDSPDAATLVRVGMADARLAAWARRNPREPRVHAARGALALVRHDYRGAADRFKDACERAPHYGEGRLGWGVALALEAERTSDPWSRRALRLRAIAQFAAVDDADRDTQCDALWNRVHLLGETGRAQEAAHFARTFLALEPTGPWAERMRVIAAAR